MYPNILYNETFIISKLIYMDALSHISQSVMD